MTQTRRPEPLGGVDHTVKTHRMIDPPGVDANRPKATPVTETIAAGTTTVVMAAAKPETAMPDGKIGAILEWVDGDKQRAMQAHWQETQGKQRKRLLANLETVLSSV